jgi:hypothetical protein
MNSLKLRLRLPQTERYTSSSQRARLVDNLSQFQGFG